MASDNILSALIGVLEGSQRGANMFLEDHMARRRRREELEQMQQGQIDLLNAKAPIEREQADYQNKLNIERERIARNEALPEPLYNTATGEVTPTLPGTKKYQTFSPPILKESTEEKEAAKRKAKLESLKPKARKSVQNTIDKMDELIGNVDELLNDEKLGRGVGWMSYLSKVPATKSKQIEGKINSIKSATSLNALSDMRNNSPTGGALGNTSDTEGNRLESSIATLDTKQDKSDAREALEKIKRNAERVKSRSLEGYELDFGESFPNLKNQGSAQPGRVMFSDPAKQARYEEYKRIKGQ